jgi:hypothetical protein
MFFIFIFFFSELYAYWIHLLFNGTVWELVFNLVTKDNTLCVGDYEFEIWIKVLTNNYEIWEIVSHLSNKNKKKNLCVVVALIFFLVTPYDYICTQILFWLLQYCYNVLSLPFWWLLLLWFVQHILMLVLYFYYTLIWQPLIYFV